MEHKRWYFKEFWSPQSSHWLPLYFLFNPWRLMGTNNICLPIFFKISFHHKKKVKHVWNEHVFYVCMALCQIILTSMISSCSFPHGLLDGSHNCFELWIWINKSISILSKKILVKCKTSQMYFAILYFSSTLVNQK